MGEGQEGVGREGKGREGKGRGGRDVLHVERKEAVSFVVVLRW